MSRLVNAAVSMLNQGTVIELRAENKKIQRQTTEKKNIYMERENREKIQRQERERREEEYIYREE